MGVRYNSTDSANLIQAMGNNVNIANTITDRLSDGCDYLIQSLNSGELQGAAYTAGKELFENIIIPAIKKLQEAVDDIQTELKSYKYADSVVSSYGVLDEDKLKEELKLKGEQLADVEKQIEDNNVSNIIAALVGGIAGSTSSINRLAANKIALENSKKNLEKDIKDIEERIEKLEWFVQEVANYFSDSLEVLRLATQGAESLGQITIDIYGNYSANGADLSWVEKMKKAEIKTYGRGNDPKKSLIAENIVKLDLSDEGAVFYKQALNEVLKNQPASEWPILIEKFNQSLYFDNEGNIISTTTMYFQDQSFTGVLKNGKFDMEYTKQLAAEQNYEEWENNKEVFLEFMAGFIKSGAGIGLSLLGITMIEGGGALSVVDLGTLSIPTVIAGAGVTASGAGLAIDGSVDMGNALSKTGAVNYSLQQASFAQNYETRVSNAPTSKTIKKNIEARVGGKKERLRIDWEPQSGQNGEGLFQVQAGSGKSGYPINEHLDVNKIVNKKSVSDWVHTNAKLSKLKKSVQNDIIDSTWRAYERFYGSGK